MKKFRMSAYKVPFVGIPFKGAWYYEWQVGPFVFQWKHALKHESRSKSVRVGRFQVWFDSAWKVRRSR